MKFEELSIHPKLLSAIQEIGYTELTPIQEKSIPHGLEGKDITGLAQTGTGKTVAFLIPVIHNILTKGIQGIAALVLAPTRELTMQIAEEAKKLLKHSEGIRSVPIIGGTDYKSQNKDLEGLNGIIVATPGRLIDMIKSGSIDISNVEFFVLDEADRMLDMGFIQDIRWLLHKCKNRKQTLLYSATLSVEVMRLAYRFLNEPVEIQINPEKIITERIDQKIVHLGREEKIPYMTNLIINSKEEGQGIIFTNYKANIPKIVYTLRKYGVPVTGISSELDQKKRLRLLRDFKSGKYRYMVATDVASRGIDVENIDIVYNYDLPQDTENYVHRIGRTARAGRKGKAIGFCSESDYVELEKIEKYLKQKIEILEVNEEYIQFPAGDFQSFIGGGILTIEKKKLILNKMGNVLTTTTAPHINTIEIAKGINDIQVIHILPRKILTRKNRLLQFKKQSYFCKRRIPFYPQNRKEKNLQKTNIDFRTKTNRAERGVVHRIVEIRIKINSSVNNTIKTNGIYSI